VVDTGGPGESIRLARDPVGGAFHVLKGRGDILRFSPGGGPPARVHDAAETGVAFPQGMAFGPDGSLYLVGNEIDDLDQRAIVRRGRRGPGERRTWTTLARTELFPRSNTTFDHQFNGIVVSPDGRHVYVNSGSRTDHGEVQTSGGRYPGLREVPLTAVMLRLPADAENLLLPDSEAGLAPYVYARGLRNSFDPAFNEAGDLLSGDNSGDRDDSDELNWLRAGHHYGFPWRMSTNDTPQQFAGYDPERDLLVNQTFNAYRSGFFHDDPSYPPRPAVPFTDPIPNHGPDADSFRDPATGAIREATEAGRPLFTFTTHRSPLGLAFDTARSLPGDFRGGAFILGWTRGDPLGDAVPGPIRDAGEDLLDLGLRRTADGYEVHARSVVCGFLNPIDTVIDAGHVYVLEFSGAGTVWEVTPSEEAPATCARVR
jgi:glucose/arabinose dehydrogenase